jgi:hypothetical protein
VIERKVSPPPQPTLGLRLVGAAMDAWEIAAVDGCGREPARAAHAAAGNERRISCRFANRPP